MRFTGIRPAAAILTVSAALILGVSGIATAKVCTPAACGAGLHKYIDFESLAPGATVEGPGAVHPDLTITSVAWPFSPSCIPGGAEVVQSGNPFPFAGYGAGANIPNGCLNGTKGFADSAGCVLDYNFTFKPGLTVSCFSVRLLDYGDLFPYGGTTHQVLLTAYDASNTIVDQAQLLMIGGVNLVTGDACTSQAGDPGNFILGVGGTGIVKVSLTYDASPDPNVGYDDIAFCEELGTTGAARTNWGMVRRLYR